MNKFVATLAIAALAVPAINADVVTSSPEPLLQNSTNVVITYHPNDAGSNKTLANLPASTQLYAHVGVITDKSSSDSDWKHAPTWCDNSAKYKLTYVGPNEYTLNIGNLSSYFGLSSTETVKKLAFVFRDANGDKQGKTSGNTDIFLTVASSDKPTLTTSYSPDRTTFRIGDEVTIKVVSTTVADLSISIANGATLATAKNSTTLTHTHKFTKENVGSMQFVCSNGGINTDKKRTVSVYDGVDAPYPGGKPVMGPVRNTDGSVTFCLAAPQISSAKLIGSWDGDSWSEDLAGQVMNACDYNGYRYYWATVDGLDADKQYFYYYLIDGSIRVADPYSKLVLDKNNDKYDGIDENWARGKMTLPSFPANCKSDLLTVYQEDMNDFEWASFDIPEHSSLYIYELLFRDFTGTEGANKGNGTVRDALAKLPYLRKLGINAIELMPIMEFNGNKSWGYNTNYYMAPDKIYGSPADYKEFINECHKYGIAVILDIVFNQCQDHPWYKMYGSDENPFINKTAPHDYSVLNDWNQDNPIVQQHWKDVLQYWLTEYNVDGFRFDLVKGLGDNSSYGSGTEAFNQSRINRMKTLHAAIQEVKPDGIHINEFLGGSSEEQQYAKDGQLVWTKLSDNAYAFAKGFGSNSQLHLFGSQTSTAVPWRNRITYAESHDEQRVAYLANKEGAASVKGSTDVIGKRLEQLAVQKLLAPGPKMIWQFEELANDENTKSGNDNNTGNKKVRWSDLDKPYVKHLYDTYVVLGNLRKDNPELFVNDRTYSQSGVSVGSISNMRTITLTYGDVEVIAFINPAVSGNAATVSVTPTKLTAANARLICASEGAAPVLTANGGKLEVSLAPNGYAVFAANTVTGVEDAIVGPDAPAYEVYGSVGEIVIVGEYRSAEVYNLQGMVIGRLTGLDRGIYVVNVDGTNHKVSVK